MKPCPARSNWIEHSAMFYVVRELSLVSRSLLRFAPASPTIRPFYFISLSQAPCVFVHAGLYTCVLASQGLENAFLLHLQTFVFQCSTLS